ncbi:hypothetical protein GPL21_35845 [Bradyrhizobium pachyrhizi]|uniref:Single Cache domain-containing protein n=1 Tax=Bradyrhizobium pachyrhizi TaxID=280333 RepID=A0A844T5U1_9BRAD|nr:cache domain-containing protein [Bradyrhizobium pachyrhizi]MVT70451.1 hypothetical protein [Bradyrhizobium pachyrhizi]
MNFRISLAQRIYAIVGLSFCGLTGLAAIQASNLANALRGQRQSELRRLTQLAFGIAQEEHDAAVGRGADGDAARRNAAARIGALRFGNGDYYWINDLGPTMIKHPIKPELDGKDLRDIRDPTGKQLFVAFAEIVKRKGEGVVERLCCRSGL